MNFICFFVSVIFVVVVALVCCFCVFFSYLVVDSLLFAVVSCIVHVFLGISLICALGKCMRALNEFVYIYIYDIRRIVRAFFFANVHTYSKSEISVLALILCVITANRKWKLHKNKSMNLLKKMLHVFLSSK